MSLSMRQIYKWHSSFKPDRDEVRSIANEAFWRACLGYDPNRGVAFSTYAIQSIIRACTNINKWERRKEEIRSKTLVHQIHGMIGVDGEELCNLIESPSDDDIGDWDDLEVLLDGLDDDERAIMISRCIDGSKLKATAAANGITVRVCVEKQNSAAEKIAKNAVRAGKIKDTTRLKQIRRTV